MKTLIIGKGEVGNALAHILSVYPLYIIDMNESYTGEVEIIHICFPYSPQFVSEVKKYQKIYQPKFTIIHSTVPVGTSAQCQAIHSPVIGIHPFLTESLKTFVKYLGGQNVSEVANYFKNTGMKIYLFDKSETTELMKLLDTSFYGLCIEYVKDVKRQCEKYDVPFEAWTLWTNNYNQGYNHLDYPEYTRPNLFPVMKKLGGHCILPNCDLIETEFTKLIKKLNE